MIFWYQAWLDKPAQVTFYFFLSRKDIVHLSNYQKPWEEGYLKNGIGILKGSIQVWKEGLGFWKSPSQFWKGELWLWTSRSCLCQNRVSLITSFFPTYSCLMLSISLFKAEVAPNMHDCLSSINWRWVWPFSESSFLGKYAVIIFGLFPPSFLATSWQTWLINETLWQPEIARLLSCIFLLQLLWEKHIFTITPLENN